MPKRRNGEGDSSRGKGANSLIWTPAMEDYLIDALLQQNVLGNRVNGSFTTAAYDQILTELKGRFPHKPFHKDKVKDHIKYMKSKWTACYNLFKGGGNGFAWNRSTNMWSAEPDVWDRLIKVHPEADEWRSKAIPNYDKLVELFAAADRATVEHAETAIAIRERRPFDAIIENDPFILDGIENIIPKDEIVLESFERINSQEPDDKEDVYETTLETKSTANSKKKSRKAKDDYFEHEIVKSMNKIAEAIKLSAIEYSKTHERSPMKEDDVWNHLVELGVEDDKIDDAYIFLTEKPEKLRTLLGCPLERRKNLLMKMLHRVSMPPPTPY